MTRKWNVTVPERDVKDLPQGWLRSLNLGTIKVLYLLVNVRYWGLLVHKLPH